MDALYVIKRIFALFLCCTLCPVLSHADQKFEQEIQAQLLKNISDSGRFEQVRFLKEMDVTLKSTGKYQVNKPESLNWIQEQPFPLTVKLASNRIVTEAPGQPSQVLTEKNDPLVFGFTRTFMALFTGEIDSLRTKFDIQLSGDKSKWNAKLQPKEAKVKKFVRGIEVKGSSFIQQIHLEDMKGNALTITLKPDKKARL